MSYLIGIDLGGTSVKGVCVTPTEELLARDHVPFGPHPMEWAERIRAILAHYQAERGQAPLAIGISAPGLTASNGSSIAHLPERLAGIEGLNWREYLGANVPVPVLNDAHAALLGECWRGAARGLDNVLLLTLGTGVGGAAIVDGHLLRGHLGRAGHFGHLSLNPDGPPGITAVPGSLEDAIGNCTIGLRSGGRFATTQALVAAHLAGDPAASAVWLKSVRALACGVASLINAFDPEAVIIGGGIARAGTALFAPLQQFLDEVEWRPGGSKVKLLAAQLGEYAGAFGVAFHAFQISTARRDT